MSINWKRWQGLPAKLNLQERDRDLVLQILMETAKGSVVLLLSVCGWVSVWTLYGCWCAYVPAVLTDFYCCSFRDNRVWFIALIRCVWVGWWSLVVILLMFVLRTSNVTDCNDAWSSFSLMFHNLNNQLKLFILLCLRKCLSKSTFCIRDLRSKIVIRFMLIGWVCVTPFQVTPCV